MDTRLKPFAGLITGTIVMIEELGECRMYNDAEDECLTVTDIGGQVYDVNYDEVIWVLHND
ncbi:MAG: hypothetical protein GY774_35620 [Planctomycetes bacterium]|nr:hypothetical protein [Planctomycetota bacterium]